MKKILLIITLIVIASTMVGCNKRTVEKEYNINAIEGFYDYSYFEKYGKIKYLPTPDEVKNRDRNLIFGVTIVIDNEEKLEALKKDKYIAEVTSNIGKLE
ncbi:hypothetical protein [Neobacillus drentensis]|uniref:hypothetical protein n=1 Tax=Neobacillus drentensis TaxID=220684 RepID=UPI002864B4BD|nr:hypothetical protein [Neobacillus drentensis]MDR7237316.1 DNA-directed RNA polymerase beta' subunit [Neobacillus drentensis]